MPLPLRVAVCGAGAFGRNHIRIYRELQASGFPVTLSAIVEPDPVRAAALAPPTAGAPITPVYPDLQQCLAHTPLDAASVCVPTTAHFAAASALLAAGVHTLIEKPITPTLAQADQLIRLARSHHRLIQVGHLERFNPAVAALSSRTHNPMFFEAHRLSLFSPRALDVDVVLDLMIHDLDIVLQLAQSPVREVRAVGLPVLSSQVDIANVRVEFDSGCVANFTASRVSTERVRKLRFFQPHQYVSVDYARQDLLIISVAPSASPAPSAPSASSASSAPSALSALSALSPSYAPSAPGHADPPPANLPASPPASLSAPDALPPFTAPPPASTRPDQPHPGLSFEKPVITPGEPLRLEILSFLESILHGTPPLVPAEQGRSALALALDVQAAMQDHARRAGLQRLAPTL